MQSCSEESVIDYYFLICGSLVFCTSLRGLKSCLQLFCGGQNDGEVASVCSSDLKRCCGSVAG